MTQLHMVKQTFANFYREHPTIAWVLTGMIGLPIASAITLGLIGIILWVLTSIFGNTLGILVFLFAFMGAVAGFIVSRILKDGNDED